MTAKISVLVGDITQQKVDAVVNAANRELTGGSGVNGAILASRGVVALVNEVAGLGVDLVAIRSAFTDRHEKYGRATAGGIVHALLELNALLSDNLGVGNNVVGLHKRRFFFSSSVQGLGKVL